MFLADGKNARPGARHPILSPGCDEVVLVGAGRNASNLIGLFEGHGLSIVAILDDRGPASVLGYPVLPIAHYSGSVRSAVMTIMDPVARRAVCERPGWIDVTWTTFVDPRAELSTRATLGDGSFIAPFVAAPDISTGRHVAIMACATIGARAAIGSFSCILPNATVGSDVTIGSGCIVGMGARIEAGVTIGNECRIAPNVVVRRDIPDHHIATTLPTRTRVFRRRGF